MKITKTSFKSMLILLLVLTLLTSAAMPAFAEEAAPDSVGTSAAASDNSSAAKEKHRSGRPKGSGGLSEDEKAELKEIFQRFGEIEKEFAALYKEELEELSERARELTRKSRRFGHSFFGSFEDFWDNWDNWERFAEDEEALMDGHPGYVEFWSDINGEQDHEVMYFDGDEWHTAASEDDTQPASDNTAEKNDSSALEEFLERVNELMEETREKGSTESAKAEGKPSIGVSVSVLSEEARAFTGKDAGVLVLSVTEDTPAAKAGIQAYDIITKVDNREIGSVEELKTLIAETAPGDTLHFYLFRQGKELELDIIPEVK